MANPIYCDWPDCGELGDYLVSPLREGGEHLGWCSAHYLELVELIASLPGEVQTDALLTPLELVRAYVARQAEEEAATVARLAGSGASLGSLDAPDSNPYVETDQAPGGAETAQEATGAPDGVQLPVDDDDAPQAILEAPSGPTVIKRGTSPSRRRHEAHKRARAAQEDPDSGGAGADTIAAGGGAGGGPGD